MIEAGNYTAQDVRRIYSRRSRVYSKTVAPLEFPNHLRAIAKAAVQPHDKVLEVAVGPGLALAALARAVDRSNSVHGVDLSPGMLEVARQTLAAAGLDNVSLSEGSASKLDFADGSFDVLYNAYMLDLIPLAEMPGILQEFSRVLKPGGRLILLNMSKPDASSRTVREYLYPLLPPRLALYAIGGCRPVLMAPIVEQAGFRRVEREFLPGKFPSEIITAVR